MSIKQCRRLEKLIDELAKGRKMEKILRSANWVDDLASTNYLEDFEMDSTPVRPVFHSALVLCKKQGIFAWKCGSETVDKTN